MESRSASAVRPDRIRIDHVEGLRAVSALVVYLNHAYAQVWFEEVGQYPTGVWNVFRLGMVWGHLAVTVFIVISGFCLTLPVVDGGDRIRGGAKEFFRRRARRILPPYYGSLVLVLALIYTIIGEPTGTLWDVPIHVDWNTIVAHVLLLQDFFRTGRINYVLWSIAVEWHIYFLFPLFVWATRKYGIVRTALAAMCVGYAMRFGFDGTRGARSNPQYLGMFALGMLAAYLVRSPREELVRLRQRVPWRLIVAASFTVTLGLCLILGIQGAAARFHLLDFPIGLMAIAILVHTTTNPSSLMTRVFGFRPLVFVGTFSYSVYLLHAPLLQVIWQYALHPLGLSPAQMMSAYLTVGLAAVLGCAYLFFKVCEEPFMRAPAPRVRPEPAADAAPAA